METVQGGVPPYGVKETLVVKWYMVNADRPGNGSYQKKWSHVWSGRVGSLGPFFEAGT